MYTGLYPPPNALHIRAANFASKELTFSWSPVAPDCPAVHYNILASNCGNCPTFTSHTNVTCTDVPTDGSNCTFAVQTVACGNLTGNVSEPISITFYPERVPIDHLYPATESLSTHTLEQSSDTNTAPYKISTGFLATALIICVVASMTMIAIMIVKRSKISAAFTPSRTEESAVRAESTYEDVTGPLSSDSIISTQDNVAYSHIYT